MNRGAQTWGCGELGRQGKRRERLKGGSQDGGGGSLKYTAANTGGRNPPSPWTASCLTQGVGAARCFADQAKAGGAGTGGPRGDGFTVGRGRRAGFRQRRLRLVHLSTKHQRNVMTWPWAHLRRGSPPYLCRLLGLPWGGTPGVRGGGSLPRAGGARELLPQGGGPVQTIPVRWVRRTSSRRIWLLKGRKHGF